MISEKELHNLADLARIKLAKNEEGKLLHDLETILAHFEELNAVDTTTVVPMTGGTTNENIYRADDGMRLAYPGPEKDFPEVAAGFLKTPPVFE